MPRGSGIINSALKAQKYAESRRKAQAREAAAALKNQERAQRAAQAEYARSVARATKEERAAQAQREVLYRQRREAEAEQDNKELDDTTSVLLQLLTSVIGTNNTLDFAGLKQTAEMPSFDMGPSFNEPAVQLQEYLPPDLTRMQRLLPGAKQRHMEQVARAHAEYDVAAAGRDARFAQYQADQRNRIIAYDRQLAETKSQLVIQHAEIDAFTRDFAEGDTSAVGSYFTLVLESSTYPEGFPQQAKVAYVPESHQLVVEYDLPTFEVVPEILAYKYVKAKDEIVGSTRPAAQRKALYTSIVAQVTLRTLYELFTADRNNYLQVIVFNGHVQTIDPATGRAAHPCLVTVRTTRETFQQFDLCRVDPGACLKVLNASVSRSPTELIPVRPVLEFDMVDPRLIDKADVLSGLDQRRNLMELTPSEFETLIANLFQNMGLETRLTQASRDGGVESMVSN